MEVAGSFGQQISEATCVTTHNHAIIHPTSSSASLLLNVTAILEADPDGLERSPARHYARLMAKHVTNTSTRHANTKRRAS
jgi:hypothetical protein